MDVFKEGEAVLKTLSVYYSGWGFDSEVWVVENTDGDIYCVGTSNGARCIVRTEELEEYVDTYREAIIETKEVINVLRGNYVYS